MGFKIFAQLIILSGCLLLCLADSNEDDCKQVINIHGGYRSEASGTRNCATEKSMAEMMRQMQDNISAIVENNTGRNICKHSCEETMNKPRDCLDIKNQGHSTTGIYTIYPGDGNVGIGVRCDMDTTTGGWTVFQRRISDSDFFKTWFEYKIGFGNVSENFWLGNDNINKISTQRFYQLRVDLISNDGEAAYAEYKIFVVGDSASDYKLLVDWFVGGNAMDGLAYHNGQRFSTKDRDNDSDNARHCAQIRFGGWWYNACLKSNLNGDYGNTSFSLGPIWNPWKPHTLPMKMTEMKIRPWYI